MARSHLTNAALGGIQAVVEARRALRLGPAELDRSQPQRLTRLVEHARARVPFYRKLYAAHGLSESPALTDLPVVSKHLMRQSDADDLVASGVSRAELHRQYTSGSTGEPFEIYTSPACDASRHAISVLIQADHRLQMDERTLLLSPLGRKTPPGAPRIIAYRRDLGHMLRELAELQATSLSGFPSYFGLLAEENARAGSPLRVKLAVCVGENLDAPTRELIERSLAERVVQIYGLQEVGVVGYECPERRGFHVHPDFMLEILGEDGRPVAQGEGESSLGEVCVTALGQYPMPFIRYNTRDLAALDRAPCPCGSRSPRLTRLSGRDGMPFTAKGGEKVSLGTLPFSWHFPGQLHRVSILQREVGVLEIEVVPSEHADSEALARALHDHLSVLYGGQFDYRLRVTAPDFARAPGKRFAMRSLVG